MPAEIVALTCDTTGTLIASHYVNPATKIACIFGTGCNAAYMERVQDIPKIASLGIDPKDEIAINCEWVRALCRALSSVATYMLCVYRARLTPLSTSTFREPSMTSLLTSRPTSQANRPLRWLTPCYASSLALMKQDRNSSRVATSARFCG